MDSLSILACRKHCCREKKLSMQKKNENLWVSENPSRKLVSVPKPQTENTHEKKNENDWQMSHQTAVQSRFNSITKVYFSKLNLGSRQLDQCKLNNTWGVKNATVLKFQSKIADFFSHANENIQLFIRNILDRTFHTISHIVFFRLFAPSRCYRSDLYSA